MLSLKNSYNNLIQPVYVALKSMILSGELQPGEKIRQEKMANMLGVSRTPLVKALQILEQEFLVENVPRRGMYVKKIDTQELIDAYECRLSIETTAVRLSCALITKTKITELRSIFSPFENKKEIDATEYMHADQMFHHKVIEFCQNKFLVKMESIANIQFFTYQQGLIRPPDETLAEHLAIIEAIEGNDVELAKLLMNSHIQKSIDLIKTIFKKL